MFCKSGDIKGKIVFVVLKGILFRFKMLICELLLKILIVAYWVNFLANLFCFHNMFCNRFKLVTWHKDLDAYAIKKT